ncbi:hypothetical protein TRFO_39372 [Tritrichomonas foetus]|uniref:Bacterial surface antigen (D15) domain-containing protein n=1 Tax=Tritrichomonas foetus TaxID=1144522 RepID=A0A1J4J6Z6_9EUKA|nr:hypothetical protein TRFO_39372 [Tritrichomonas foetus]|eukprot:OHS94425.1 hypothetical protein TRFO_39372 [Tritrichomonas foetus]
MERFRNKIVNFDTIPDWFPKEKFKDYIRKEYATKNLTLAQEDLFFKDISQRLNNLNFGKEFRVYKQRSKLLPFWSTVRTTGKTRNSFTPMKFGVNISNWGFDFSCGQSADINTVEFESSYYLFKSGSVAIKYSTPLLNYPNFSKQCIYPIFSTKVLYNRKEFNEQIIKCRGVESSITNPNSTLSFTLFGHFINYKLTHDHKPIFDKECLPFFNIAAKIDHNFQISNKFLLIGKTFTKILMEPGIVIERERIFPMMTNRFQIKMNLPFNGVIHLDSGFILTQNDSKIPLCKRFHVGGVPTMRGIRMNEFSPKIDEIPCGSDSFFSVGVNQILPFHYFVDPRLKGHVFVNGGISRLAQKDELNKIDFSYFLSYGAGIILEIMERTIEVNIALPASLSQDLKLMMFQVGIDSTSSERE